MTKWYTVHTDGCLLLQQRLLGIVRMRGVIQHFVDWYVSAECQIYCFEGHQFFGWVYFRFFARMTHLCWSDDLENDWENSTALHNFIHLNGQTLSSEAVISTVRVWYSDVYRKTYRHCLDTENNNSFLSVDSIHFQCVEHFFSLSLFESFPISIDLAFPSYHLQTFSASHSTTSQCMWYVRKPITDLCIATKTHNRLWHSINAQAQECTVDFRGTYLALNLFKAEARVVILSVIEMQNRIW